MSKRLRSINMNDYLYWISERHSIWGKRHLGWPAPWTDDEHFQQRKYCNVFRVLDRESQYSVKNLFSDETATSDDFLLRALLFRLTIRPEPWQYFYQEHGRMPIVRDLLDKTIHETWQEFHNGGGLLFKSGVYLVHIPRDRKGTPKMEYYLEVITEAFQTGMPEAFKEATTAKEKLKAIQMIPRFGPFMSQQVLTDHGYSLAGADYENDYVEIGPGSIRGLERLKLDGRDPQKAMRKLQKTVHEELPFIQLHLESGVGRKPSLMDIQNTLCEVDKYARLKFREGNSQKFTPTEGHRALPKPVFPAIWSQPALKGNQ